MITIGSSSDEAETVTNHCSSPSDISDGDEVEEVEESDAVQGTERQDMPVSQTFYFFLFFYYLKKI